VGLVKYIDPEDNKLTADKNNFVFNLLDQPQFREFSFSSLNVVVEVVTGCIQDEVREITLDIIRKNNERIASRINVSKDGHKDTAEIKVILSVLDKIESLKNPIEPVNVLYLVQRSLYYKKLLTLFGHSQAPESIKDFIVKYKIPERYLADGGKELTHLAKEIFDNIKQATTRSLQPQTETDICKEDWEAYHSSDPKDKWAKKDALKKISQLPVSEIEPIETKKRKVSFEDEIQEDSQNETNLSEATSTSPNVILAKQIAKAKQILGFKH
jgi:hypothetical protein